MPHLKQQQDEAGLILFKCAAFIEFIITRLGIHEHNVSIVAYRLNIGVGGGFPCLGHALLASCEACS